MNNTRCVLGNLVVIGLGSVGSTFVAMVGGHFKVYGQKIGVSTMAEHRPIAEANGFDFRQEFISQSNFRRIVTPLLTPGSLLVNLSVDVSSLDLMLLCRERNSLYVDTCTEPWAGVYGNQRVPQWERSNHGLRMALIEALRGDGPTAISTHGANPGWVSHLAKEGLLAIADHLGEEYRDPSSREEWASLSMRLGVRVIQVAERDWQRPTVHIPPGTVACPWSVDGFLSEAYGQCGELGWGSHEPSLPPDAELRDGIVLLHDDQRPHIVKSWTPMSGEHDALLVTHAESVTLSSLLSVEGEHPYRPTVYYAYRPIDDAWKSRLRPVWKNLSLESGERLTLSKGQLDDGVDELGVLLMGERFGALWIGSTLSSSQSESMVPGSSATSLQVSAGVLAACLACIDEPLLGHVEPEDMDHRKALSIAAPFLGQIERVFSDWYPSGGAGGHAMRDFLVP